MQLATGPDYNLQILSDHLPVGESATHPVMGRPIKFNGGMLYPPMKLFVFHKGKEIFARCPKILENERARRYPLNKVLRRKRCPQTGKHSSTHRRDAKRLLTSPMFAKYLPVYCLSFDDCSCSNASGRGS